MTDLSVKVINGAVAGVVGVAATFPLDLVKTNLQLNPGKFNGILDCFRKINSVGGLTSFYRGIAPNILLISPEKAIKLTCNDVFRKQLSSNRKSLPLHYECLAGGGAGLCQVVITSPMELLKIRGQSKAQLSGPNTSQTSAKTSSPSLLGEVLKVIRNDGIRGIYRGAGSTLVRDIPFSMTYFPLFAHLNHLNLNQDGTSKPLWSLASGLGAGAFSAWLFTPMDYVKTKIQSPNAPKDISYSSVARSIWKSQGLLGFFTGALPRVMVMAPLFGVAQAVYYIGVAEVLLGRQTWDKPTL